jgi:hypothetical protein
MSHTDHSVSDLSAAILGCWPKGEALGFDDVGKILWKSLWKNSETSDKNSSNLEEDSENCCGLTHTVFDFLCTEYNGSSLFALGMLEFSEEMQKRAKKKTKEITKTNSKLVADIAQVIMNWREKKPA